MRFAPLPCLVVLLVLLAVCHAGPAGAAMQRISVHSNGAQANSYSFNPVFSADGGTVSFYSYATNLVTPGVSGRHGFAHSLATRQTWLADTVLPETAGAADRTPDGCVVAYTSFDDLAMATDTNAMSDILVSDCRTGQVSRVSVDSAGRQANANSYGPSISDDGRFVAFYSYASNLVPGDTNGLADVFLHDRNTGQTTRVSLGPGGVQANDHCFDPSISPDGRYVAFRSRASNLVPGDTNNQIDIFVAGPFGGAITGALHVLLGR